MPDRTQKKIKCKKKKYIYLVFSGYIFLTMCKKSYYVSFSLYLKVAAKKYCNFEIPAHFTGVHRYMQNAYEREEFSQTCPANIEIEKAYLSVVSKRT